MANVNHLARLKGAVLLMLATGALIACNKDKILTVTDPDIINPGSLGSAEGAEALRSDKASKVADVLRRDLVEPEDCEALRIIKRFVGDAECLELR